jgi:hypothetical protein
MRVDFAIARNQCEAALAHHLDERPQLLGVHWCEDHTGDVQVNP